jgi:hypothetical protein
MFHQAMKRRHHISMALLLAVQSSSSPACRRLPSNVFQKQDPDRRAQLTMSDSCFGFTGNGCGAHLACFVAFIV